MKDVASHFLVICVYKITWSNRTLLFFDQSYQRILFLIQVQEEAGLMITVDHDGPLDQQLNGAEDERLPVKLSVTPSKRPRGRPRKIQAVARPVKRIVCSSLLFTLHYDSSKNHSLLLSRGISWTMKESGYFAVNDY